MVPPNERKANSASLYVIFPAHNRKHVTEKLIRSLKEQTYQDFTLVLVDDGSTDGTSEMVRGYFGNVVVIRGKGNCIGRQVIKFSRKALFLTSIILQSA